MGAHHQAFIGQRSADGAQQRGQNKLGKRVADARQRAHQSHFDVANFAVGSSVFQHYQMQAGDKGHKVDVGIVEIQVFLQSGLQGVVIVLVHLAQGGIQHIGVTEALIVAVVKTILNKIGAQGCFEIILFCQYVRCHLRIQPPHLRQRRHLCSR